MKIEKILKIISDLKIMQEDLKVFDSKIKEEKLKLDELMNLQNGLVYKEKSLETGKSFLEKKAEKFKKYNTLLINLPKKIDSLIENEKHLLNTIEIFSKTKADMITFQNKLEIFKNKQDKFLSRTKEDLEKLKTSKDFQDSIEEEIQKKGWLDNELICQQKKLYQNAKYKQLSEEKITLEAQYNNDKQLYNESCTCGFDDHTCPEHCAACGENVNCKGKCGHYGMHLCDQPEHYCKQKCGKKTCKEKCQKSYGHEGEHTCNSRHECKKPCKYCPNACSLYIYDEHKKHICKSNTCSVKCSLCSAPCATKKHDHQDELDAKHLCGKKHACNKPCTMDGACSIGIIIKEIKKEWKTENDSYEYIYICNELSRASCIIELDTMEMKHSGPCKCNSEGHRCTQKCPACGQLCFGNYGHEGRHYSNSHRNMEFCVFATTETNREIKIKDEGRKYLVGEKTTPERCYEQCIRKGRGHFHLKECPGGANCAEKIFANQARHSNLIYEPYPTKQYDQVLCATFWESFGWKCPVIEPEKLKEINSCNYYCPRPHKNAPDKVFCRQKTWHSTSNKIQDHGFEYQNNVKQWILCNEEHKKEPIISKINLCFLIDTTGSMSSAITNCKLTIKRIMSETQAQQKNGIEIKIAIVEYKDHCDPVVCSKQDFSTDIEATNFLEKLCATGGGDGAEAVVDGLDLCNKLNWSDNSLKFLIHLLDFPPHGKEFEYSSDDHKDGCPCKLQYSKILTNLNSKGVKYYIIKFSTCIEKMIKIFRNFIPVNDISIADSIDYKDHIVNLICKNSKDLEQTVLESKQILHYQSLRIYKLLHRQLNEYFYLHNLAIYTYKCLKYIMQEV